MQHVKKRILRLEQRYHPEPCILALDLPNGAVQRMTVDEYIAAGGICALPMFKATHCKLKDAAKLLDQVASVIQ